MTPVTCDFLNVLCCPSPPTHQNERLDLLFSNESERITCETSSPLDCDNENSQPSDHMILECRLNLPHRHDFVWVKYKTRDTKEKNKAKFIEQYCAVDWQTLLQNIRCPSRMVEVLHDKINELTEACMPL